MTRQRSLTAAAHGAARRGATAALALSLLVGCATAPAPPTAPAATAGLREEIVRVPVADAPLVELETTLFLPPTGRGPFPLIVVNHGKAPGDPHQQARARFVWAAREFVARGYAVALPMREGFANSGGRYPPTGCDIAANGRMSARDVRATIAHLEHRPDIDARRVVLVGQSHGGLVALAAASEDVPHVVGVVNFAGGLRNERCPEWSKALVTAAADYARTTRVPSLWFYGDNDSAFDPPLWHEMHAQYVAAGGDAQLVAFGRFGTDAHALFGARSGVPVWEPEVARFFTAKLGLPFERRGD